jgi:hypothetical protein
VNIGVLRTFEVIERVGQAVLLSLAIEVQMGEIDQRCRITYVEWNDRLDVFSQIRLPSLLSGAGSYALSIDGGAMRNGSHAIDRRGLSLWPFVRLRHEHEQTRLEMDADRIWRIIGTSIRVLKSADSLDVRDAFQHQILLIFDPPVGDIAERF